MDKANAKSSKFEILNIFHSFEVELQEPTDGDSPFTLMEVLRIYNYVSQISGRQGSNFVSSFVSGFL
jgi:hypothetical protein